MLAYGIMGGAPQCLLQMSDKLSIKDNIKKTFLDVTSPIYEEPMNLLKQEVRETAIYKAIILLTIIQRNHTYHLMMTPGDGHASPFFSQFSMLLFCIGSTDGLISMKKTERKEKDDESA